MEVQFPKDDLFFKMMQNSGLEMPFADFEESTMARINLQTVYKSSFSKYRKLAILFFILGTGFGFVLTYFLSLPKMLIAGIPSDTILLLCRTVYVLLVLTQLNNILGLLRSAYGKHRFTLR